MCKTNQNLCESFHMHEIHHGKKEFKTLIVVIITIVMMVIEISTGMIFGSMALLSDGIHMGTHTLALAITLIAYVISRKNAKNSNFSFGTGKVGVLGGYTSAIALLIAAIIMVYESIERLISPVNIGFNESILVAVIGLIINLISALILNQSHDHSHHHGHDHSHHHHHHHHEDHNLKAAYLHVIADALTSVLAIIALLAGKYYNAIWLDPAVGIAGGFVVGKWAVGLLNATGKILLDFDITHELEEKIITSIEELHKCKVMDIHLWRVDDNNRAILLSIKDDEKRSPQFFKNCLKEISDFVHITIEVI